MNILVTGGAGYIGSVVVEELVRQGHDVVVFDNLSQGHRGAVPAGVPLVVGDLADAAAVKATFDAHRFEGVMHFASHILPGESMQKPFKYIGDNVTNGLTLLREMVDRDAVKSYLLTMHTSRPFMPPFPGTDLEAGALSDYLVSLHAFPAGLDGAQTTGVPLPGPAPEPSDDAAAAGGPGA